MINKLKVWQPVLLMKQSIHKGKDRVKKKEADWDALKPNSK